MFRFTPISYPLNKQRQEKVREIIEKLIKKGHAYSNNNGDVLINGSTNISAAEALPLLTNTAIG